MQTPTPTPKIRRPLRLSLLALACAAAVGCASVQPVAVPPQEMASQIQKDGKAIGKDVTPLSGPLNLEEALARALKYNLDRRSRMMEEALTRGQLDVSKFDMLPKIMAQAGYASRDRARFTHSSSFPLE